jgi:hypothetical protein
MIATLTSTNALASNLQLWRTAVAAALGKYTGTNRFLYVKLAAPFTVNTMHKKILLALAQQRTLGLIIPFDGGQCEEVLWKNGKSGADW